MADTGAPYFIPYVEPTDLVRDYPAADEASADAIAAALDAIPVLAGIGSNVVTALLTSTFSATAAAGALSGDITGLTATITPTTATSKVLVILTLTATQVSKHPVVVSVFRDGAASIAIGDADGNRRRVFGSITTASQQGEVSPPTSTFVFVDSPATASAVTYSVRVGSTGTVTETVLVNRPINDGLGSRSTRTASSITVIEVAA